MCRDPCLRKGRQDRMPEATTDTYEPKITQTKNSVRHYSEIKAMALDEGEHSPEVCNSSFAQGRPEYYVPMQRHKPPECVSS